MPRGTQFAEVINAFREETGRASSRQLGLNELPGIMALLRRTYRRLHTDFDWPHLEIVRTKTLSAGERYYSFPADLDFDRLTERPVIVPAGTDLKVRLDYAISMENLNAVNSDEGERRDHPLRWEVYESDQFEVWPVPVSNGDVVTFRGISRAKTLTSESDTLDLDDDLVVLYAAAERLARDKSGDAEHKLKLARQLYLRLRGNTQKDANVNMMVNQDRRTPFPGIHIRVNR